MFLESRRCVRKHSSNDLVRVGNHTITTIFMKISARYFFKTTSELEVASIIPCFVEHVVGSGDNVMNRGFGSDTPTKYALGLVILLGFILVRTVVSDIGISIPCVCVFYG